MVIEYDPDKNQTNITNRDLSFDLVAEFKFESALTTVDDRKNTQRFATSRLDILVNGCTLLFTPLSQRECA